MASEGVSGAVSGNISGRSEGVSGGRRRSRGAAAGRPAARGSNAVLGAGFGLTGVGTVMLGVLLPTLAQRWHLADDAAGMLFFLQFLGSSVGALLTGGGRGRALLAGYGVLLASGAALTFAGPELAFAAFFCWGLGLGMAMTATSLLISGRAGAERAAWLERLNFVWSAGAAAAPVLFLRFLHAGNVRSIFVSLEGLLLLVFLWVLLRERQDEPRAAAPVLQPGRQGRVGAHTSLLSRASLLRLVLLALCAVGVESALSGWMTTYSHRAAPGEMGGGALATSCFWLGILLGRLLCSTRLLAAVGRQRVLSATLAGTAAAVAMLMASHSGGAIDGAAVLAGMSIGPVYPLLLSFLLEHSPHGWVFAVAGMGSAVFPWLTGVLSAHFGSLRLGLAAPGGAALAMLVLRWARPGRESAAATTLPQT